MAAALEAVARVKSCCRGVCVLMTRCAHGRQRGWCKECDGHKLCPHGRVPRRCTLCGGKDICEHRKIRTCCAACGGRQICPHGVRLYMCRTCEGGGGAFCTHGRVRHTCRLCNPRHPMHGVVARVGSNGQVRGSDVEHMMLDALLERLPSGAVATEQFHVPSPHGTRFRIDMALEFAGTRFLVEVDGAQHYREFPGHDTERQLARDRHVERWGVANGCAVFRIPESVARSRPRRALAVEYVVHGMRHGATGVHYMDYSKTYARINSIACELGDVEFIFAKRVLGNTLDTHVAVLPRDRHAGGVTTGGAQSPRSVSASTRAAGTRGV